VGDLAGEAGDGAAQIVWYCRSSVDPCSPRSSALLVAKFIAASCTTA
jgi:hypothetical protein